MAGRRYPRPLRRRPLRSRSRVAVLTQALLLSIMVLAVVLLLRPGADAAHAEIDASSQPDPLEGVARIIDGDTLDVGTVRVRLHGIDAFERNQTCDGPRGPWACGAAAANALKSRAEGRRLVCRVLDTDRYGRKVSRCERDGVDLGRELVSEGLAMAYRRYSQDYVGVEETARAEAAGAWSGSFDRPEQWRSRSRRST